MVGSSKQVDPLSSDTERNKKTLPKRLDTQSPEGAYGGWPLRKSYLTEPWLFAERLAATERGSKWMSAVALLWSLIRRSASSPYQLVQVSRTLKLVWKKLYHCLVQKNLETTRKTSDLLKTVVMMYDALHHAASLSPKGNPFL